MWTRTTDDTGAVTTSGTFACTPLDPTETHPAIGSGPGGMVRDALLCVPETKADRMTRELAENAGKRATGRLHRKTQTR